MNALLLPVAEPAMDEIYFRRREAGNRRRLNFEFFDQLDCLDLSDLPRYVSEELEGAD
jgi:hypothetical protein